MQSCIDVLNGQLRVRTRIKKAQGLKPWAFALQQSITYTLTVSATLLKSLILSKFM